MKITSIEKQKNNKNKYSIFIDDSFAFSLDYLDILNYKLKIGKFLNKVEYNIIINKSILNNAKNTALKYLYYKKRTRKEIENKLKTLNYTDDIIYKVINILIKYKYIDDYNYAYCYIKEKTSIKPQGKIKIKYDLKLKGIQEEIIDKIFNDINILEEENIIKLINKKFKNINNLDEISLKEKNRIYNFLLRKGFSFQDINLALKNINNL